MTPIDSSIPKKISSNPTEHHPGTSGPLSLTQFTLGSLDKKAQPKTTHTSEENHGKDHPKTNFPENKTQVGPLVSYGLEGGHP